MSGPEKSEPDLLQITADSCGAH